MSFHIQMRVDELTAMGMDAAKALRRAREEFGDLEQTRRYCREVDARAERRTRVADRLAEWWQDVRFALRTLRRAPGFTAISLFTLALAIGANTAIFSAARAVLLAPLPYGDPGALVSVSESWPRDPGSHAPLSPPNFVDYREQQRAFTDMAAFADAPSAVWQPATGDPTNVTTMAVGSNLFDVLRVRALRGRTFSPGDDARGSDDIVLSFAFWQRELGGADVVGERIILDGKSRQIIGVMPRGFTLRGTEDLWIPLDMSEDLANAAVTRKQHWVHAIGRLRPGETLAGARANLAVVGRRLATQYLKADSGRAPVLVPLRDVMVGDLRSPLLLLQCAAGLVLLIACANLANVTLSRTIGRRREMALRAALGAGRARIVRQLLTESVLLAVVGGGAGVALASLDTRTLLTTYPDALPAMFAVGVDSRVLFFSLALSMVTGILFGLVPALDAMRANLHDALKEGGRAVSGRRGGDRVRRALVVAQVALAVMLLVGAGLLLRSFGELARVQLGFKPEHVLTAQLRLGSARYDSASAVNRVMDELLERIASSPGVVAAGAASTLPTRGSVSTSLRIEGESASEADAPDIDYVGIRGSYLDAMRVPLIAGREYDQSDRPGGPRTVLINQAAARRFFPRGSAVGRRIRIGPSPDGEWMTIVGVVGDVRGESVDLPARPALFANHRQEAWQRTLSIVIRTTSDPRAAIPALRSAVRSADPTLALRDIEPLDDVIGSSLAPRRFALGLASLFAALALVLAAVGIYGVLAYAVTIRTREFGVRLALGASARSVLSLVVRQGFGWTLEGLALGVGGALAGGRLLRGILYGVSPLDVSTYVYVVLGLFLVVATACVIPATRATRVDPLESLRAE